MVASRRRRPDAGAYQVAETRQKLLAEVKDNIRRRGGAQTLFIASYRVDRTLEGKHLEEIATAKGRSPEETALDLLLAGDASLVSFNMSERDVEHLMKQPYTMTSSDGGLILPTEGEPHPRNSGAFARKLARYVRERQVIDWEFAIRSMTSLPATVFGLEDRGMLRAGAWPDLAIFNLSTVLDKATCQNPHQLAEGMDFVLVNGLVVLDRGRFTTALPGKVLGRR